MRIGGGSLVGNAVTLSLVTRLPSQRLDRTVVDKTIWTAALIFDSTGLPMSEKWR